MRKLLLSLVPLLLVACDREAGTAVTQQDQDTHVALASAALSAPGHGNGAAVLFDAFPWNANFNVSPKVEDDGTQLVILETSDPDYGRQFWCPTFPPAPGWPENVPGFPDGWLPMRSLDVITPAIPGKYNWWIKGLQYITIFKHSGEVGPTEPPTAFWCDIVSLVSSEKIAWGVAEFQLKAHWDNNDQASFTQSAKGTLTAPGCPSGKARFEAYGPISSTAVYGSFDFACSKD